MKTGGEQNTMTKTTKGNKKNRKGFSLLELVVVVAIIGIIASAVMINAGQHLTYAAKVNTWKTSMNSLKDSLILYSATHDGAFPTLKGGNFYASDSGNINLWLKVRGAYFLDKPITNPFKGGTEAHICTPESGFLKPVDQAPYPEACVIQYTTTTFYDPINNLTINNGSFTITYMIGTQTYTITFP